jgi:hypothetical protein
MDWIMNRTTHSDRTRPVALLALSLVALCTSVTAQGPAGSDIYLIPMSVERGSVQFGEPTNATRRSGYDNQPSFTADGSSILYTSIRDGQADTYRYEIVSGQTTQVTRTAESEYSPMVTPRGTAFSVVRVEADSTQRLWAFNLDGTHPHIVLEDVKPVGYHAWGDEYTLALFVLGSPSTLQIADTRTGASEIMAHNIGRSLHKIPNRAAFSFMHRTPDAGSWISAIDMATHEIRAIVQPAGENEFYAWTPDGRILMGEGSALHLWREGGSWREVADFTTSGLTGISRIAVSADGKWVAVVAQDS